MSVYIISGSRADRGLLEPVYEQFIKQGIQATWWNQYAPTNCTLAVMLGDRHEILTCAMRFYMHRVPIAHLCGGDVTLGSYDDAFRDCLSRLATWHFVTNEQAETRLKLLRYENVHNVGSTAKEAQRLSPVVRLHDRPYVVVSYQPETATGVNRIHEVLDSLPTDKLRIIFLPNDDEGYDDIAATIKRYKDRHGDVEVHDRVPASYFRSLIAHCDEFVGNSSAMLYEAPLLGVKCRMIGDRQQGRVKPWSDGKASERIVTILKAWHESH